MICCRFNILIPSVDYKTEFHTLLSHTPAIIEIINSLKKAGAIDAWYFFEPHIEITFFCNSEDEERLRILGQELIKNTWPAARIEYLEAPPDWFCKNEGEREFGGFRHGICFKWIENYFKYKGAVDRGKGLEEQVKRTIHTLCNPLGLNYWKEARLCFSRGLICVLFMLFSFKTAVWIYTKVFRQKY